MIARTFKALVVGTCLTSLTFTALPVSPAFAQAAMVASNAGYSQQGSRVLLDAVRAAVRQNPALADGVGDRALLTGVQNAVKARPELAESIRASAKSIRPNMAAQIDNVVRYASAPPAQMQVPVQQAPVPQATIQQTTTQQVWQMPATTPAATPAAEGGAAAGGGLVGGLGDAALLGLAGAAAISVGVVAATGGGGGDKGTLPPPSENSQEYDNQWGLGAINASAAYARGADGTGVKVAVADTGLLVTHTDIDSNVDPNGYDFEEDDTDVTDDEGHGTHVSGIIAAEKDGNPGAANMHGVAYGADILPLRIIGPGGASASDIADAVDYAVTQNALIYNGSYGPDYSSIVYTQQIIGAGDALTASAYLDAENAGMVMVFAAGNDFDDNPTVAVNPGGAGLYPYVKPANAGSGVYNDSGANYDFSALEGLLVAVVATDEDGGIADYSNRCGVAADWCMAAPGSDILSTYNNGGYTTLSGTSMAAPHVSGAVAVLIDMFPSLTPEEIVERLFLAANKTGVYADSSVYGQGFLDLEKATRPIGSLSVSFGSTLSNARSFDLKSSNMNLGPAFGDGLRVALVGQKLAVFDQQNAPFMVNLADFTRAADTKLDLNAALSRFRSRFGEKTIKLGDGSSLRYAMVDLGRSDNMRLDPALGDDDTVMELAYAQAMGDTLWKMNYNMNPSTMFGIYQSQGLESAAMLSPDAFSAPYLAFAKQGFSMGAALPLNDRFSLNVATFQGHPLTDEMRSPEEQAESYGHTAELAYKSGGLALYSQLGMLTEKQTFLGSRTEGAFDLAGGTQTSFAGLNMSYKLTGHWNLVGSYYRGISNPQVNSQSLFDDISEIQTESFSLGMMGKDVLQEGDSFGILGNQPLRVVNGDASLSLAAGRDRAGTLYMRHYEANLAPSGRELNAEVFYGLNLPESDTKLMGTMMYRNQPGHVEDAPDEGLFLMQLQQPF